MVTNKKKARSRRHHAETRTDADYAGDQILLVNTPAQTESLRNNQEKAARGIGLYENTNKRKSMCFKKKIEPTLQ